MIIENYLNNILSPLLVEYKVKYRYVLKICEDIRNRMFSILHLWNDEKKRNAILFLSKEEAPYYLPKSKPFIAEFVVTTIRNSMLEVAASDNCHSIKMIQALSNEEIKKITSSAIIYFGEYGFEEMMHELPLEFVNVYENAINKYPIAWNALLNISNMDQQIFELSNSEANEPRALSNESVATSKIEVAVCDGYSVSFDTQLCSMLNKIISGENSVFFVDCSKMLTRNFEKYLHVLEIILKSNGVFCTCNYFISNHCLEKRKRFIRAAHTSQDFTDNMGKTVNATPNIRRIMESFNKN